MTLLSAAVLLFFVMDPLGNVPLYLSALQAVEPERRRWVTVRELFFALGILIGFLFFGTSLLNALSISPPALRTAGGIVLMLIAIRMIFPTDQANLREEVREEPFVFPLAVPYTAGPSAMATELLLMSTQPERWPVWVAAILLAWVPAAIILCMAADLRRLIGDRGLKAMERLMGMLLVTVAVEMMMDGIGQYLHLVP